jgi:hypothetical protein
MTMQMKTRATNGTAYRQDRKTAADGAHYADTCAADRGEIHPVYRGFRVTCSASELPAKQKAIDGFWSRAYSAAQTPAARQAVIDQEREWRNAPREWV